MIRLGIRLYEESVDFDRERRYTHASMLDVAEAELDAAYADAKAWLARRRKPSAEETTEAGAKAVDHA